MSANFPKEVYLNGDWKPAQEASVSVFDRGFMLGDGIYEVIPFYKGVPFLMKEHLDRLFYCLQEVRLLTDVRNWEGLIKTAIEKASLVDEDGAVYIQVTRGVAPRTHYFPEKPAPTVLIYAFPVALEGFEKKLAKAVLLEDRRWHRCDIKSISLMGNVLANEQAHHEGYHEAILVRQGLFTEGTHTSVFFVLEGKVYTHPEGPHILPGITRKEVIRVCARIGIDVIEEAVESDRMAEIDEAFFTGTTTQVLAIGQVNDDDKIVFQREETGPITKKIQQAFAESVREHCSSILRG